jgi:drug/metabolite transporter (DMT)-like permease
LQASGEDDTNQSGHHERVHAETVIALVLAFASTCLISLSYLREHGAVAGLPPLSLRRPLDSLRLLLTTPAWLIGFAMESSGFALYVVALALAPLALVQCVEAGGVGILAVAAARLARRRLSGREAWGASFAVAGLALLAVSLSGGNDSSASGSLGEIGLWLGVTSGTAALVITSTRRFLSHGVGNGIAGGLLFAVGDICTKLATEGGSRTLFVIPLIVAYLLGTSLLQIGYQSGAALTVAGIATLLTNAVPIAAGTVLLHEPLPTGALGVIRVLAFAAVVTGAILLAKADAPRPAPPPAGAPRLAGSEEPPLRSEPPAQSQSA